MTAADPTTGPAGALPEATSPAATPPPTAPPAASGNIIPMKVVPPTWWDRAEVWLERAGEFVNPILVKEARQALKSKQFVITFTLVLLFGWGWSLLGLAIMRQAVYYAPGGPHMLMGYLWVLAFPLMVIVPFAAFRSLASEREDGTYELLSITTLWPRQIVAGKLASALLQMLVYLSALAPCIAFTYLLRGIDILSILIFVCYVFVASVLFSMAGLLLATVSKSRHWQVVLSVVMILALAGAYIFSASMMTAFLQDGPGMPLDEPEFWVAHVMLLTVAVSFFALMYVASAARLTFSSDNRSTRLRIVMLAQQTLMTGWFIYYLLLVRAVRTDIDAILMIYFSFAAVYWTVTGAIMCGETPQLSQRAKRSLPQSLLARALFTWLNPGPGTGYMFAFCNLLGVLLIGTLVGLEVEYQDTAGGLVGVATSFLISLDPRQAGFTGSWKALWSALGGADDWFWFGVLSFCYVVCYLGLGRLIILVVRRVARVGLFVSFLLQLVLVLLGSLVPLAVQFPLFPEDGYTALQITSPVWTLVETAKGDILSHTARVLYWNIPVVPPVLLGVAGVMALINLVAASSEAEHERIAAPQRVVEDERALHPQRHEKPTRLSPWDEDPVT